MDMKSLRALKQGRINIKSMQLGDDEALESEAMERYFKTLHASGGQHFTSGRSRTNGKTMCIWRSGLGVNILGIRRPNKQAGKGK